MWLQHFFRASPQTAPSWRSWIRYRCKLLRWSTPWSKFFWFLKSSLEIKTVHFTRFVEKSYPRPQAVSSKDKISFRRTSLKLSEPNSAFETLNGDSWNVRATKLKQAMVNTENFFRWDFMVSSCGTYFYLENHQSALFKTGRKDFHNELVEKIFSGYPPVRFENAPPSALEKKGTIDAAI